MHIHNNKDFRFFKFIPWIFIGIAGAAALALIFGLIVMALWNWIMPDIFGLPPVSYWQAWGLVLLAHILFKGHLGHHPHQPPHSPNSQSGHWTHAHWNKEEMHRKFAERFNRPCSHSPNSGHPPNSGHTSNSGSNPNADAKPDPKPDDEAASDATPNSSPNSKPDAEPAPDNSQNSSVNSDKNQK